MRRLSAFNVVSVDGYIADVNGDMSWAHRHDPEWTAFIEKNAGSGGVLLFGRVTYDMMASWWPTPQAAAAMPVVAERMNNGPKVVFSRTMDEAVWNNTTLVKEDIAGFVRTMKAESGPDMVILGSGSIIPQLADEGLIDRFEFVINPIVFGCGKGMFEKIGSPIHLRLANTRLFENGNVLLCYEYTA